jgi:hypothetical protein
VTWWPWPLKNSTAAEPTNPLEPLMRICMAGTPLNKKEVGYASA